MPKITYIASTGTEHAVDADCGGVADCGTCHVWVDQNWLDRIGPARPGSEAEMLALTDGSTPFSRLACQIELDDSHEGLVLGMPTDQHRGRHAEFTKHRSQYVPASLIQPPCTRRR